MTAGEGSRPKIIYLLGSARSGSTILDTMIGNAPTVLSTGELGHLFWAFDAARAGQSSAVSWCSCGRLVLDCPVWSAVWAELATKYDMRTLARSIEQYETVVRSIPIDAVARLFRTRAFRYHLEGLADTVRSVVRVGGAPTLVDSSKSAGRAWLYSLLPSEEFDVRFLHLVREGPSVVSSMVTHYEPHESVSRPSPYPSLIAAGFATAHWGYMNVVASMQGALNRGRYRRLRYEDLVRQPLETLASLEPFLGVDLGEPRRRIADGEPLAPGHVLCGNRGKGSRRFRPETAGRATDSLSRGQTMVFQLLAGWLQMYYTSTGPPPPALVSPVRA